MQVVFGILLVFLASIAPLNKYVFKAVNLDELKRVGNTRLSAAEKLQGEQRYAAAKESLENIVKDFKPGKDPISLYIVQRAMYDVGMGLANEFDYEGSIGALNKLVKNYPETPYAEQVFFTNGQSFIKIQQYAAAISEFEKIEKNREIAKSFPKYKYADLEPEKYVNLDKLGAPTARQQKVSVYTKEMQKAEASGEKKEEAGNLLSDAVIAIGECYLQLNQPEKARDEFSLIIKYFPNSDVVDNAQKLIADSYLLEGKLALEKAEKADSLGEKRLLKERATTYFDRAANSYLKFINVYTQSDLISAVYIKLGDVYFKMKDNARANFAFERALTSTRLPDEQAKIQMDIGRYFEDEKKFKEAIAAYAKVLQNFSKSSVADRAVYLTGACYEETGDTTKSIEYFTNICEFYKSSQFYPSAAYKLGIEYRRLKDDKKALQYFRSGIQLFPNSQVAAQTQFQIGLLFKDQKEYKPALEEFELLQGDYAGTEYAAKALYQMVDCYKQMGDMDKAKETALRIKDNSELIIESYKLLGIGASTPEEELKLWQDKVTEAQDPKSKVAAIMEVARIQLYKLQQLDEALRNYDTVLTLTQDAIRVINAKVGIGQIYSQKKEYDKALKVYDEILNDPKTVEQVRIQIQYKVYDTYRRQGNYVKAREGYKVFLEENRANDLAAYAQFSLGVCYTEEKQYDKAMAEYQKVLDEFKQSDIAGQAMLAIGQSYKEQGQVDQAIEYWLKMLKENPGIDVTPQMYFQIGGAYKGDKQDFAKAATYFDKVVTDFSDSPLFSTAAFMLGDCYQKLEKDKEAIASYDKVKPEEKSIRKAADAEIGRLLGKTDPQAAIASYDKIIAGAESDNDRAIAEMGKGDIYVQIEKFKQAAESFHKIYAEYKAAGDTMRGAALVKEIDANNQLKQYNEVIQLSDVMQKEFPDNPYTINAVYFKANAYYSSNRYGQAREVFGELIKMDKSEQLTEIAYYQKADCLLFMEKYNEAVREYRQYIERYKDGKYIPICVYQIANCYWAQQEFEKAKVEYERVVNKYPDFSELCSAKGFLGFCNDQLGNWRKARTLYREVVNNKGCQGEARKFAKEQLDANLVKH